MSKARVTAETKVVRMAEPRADLMVGGWALPKVDHSECSWASEKAEPMAQMLAALTAHMLVALSVEHLALMKAVP